jgi:hypothetical protein
VSRASISYETNFTAEHEPPGFDRHVNEFKLVVTIEGPIVGGLVMPFGTLGAIVANLLRCIEAVPPIEALPDGSSGDQMAVWIWHQLARELPGLVSVALTDGAYTVTYRGES